jgi:hypothetical protein
MNQALYAHMNNKRKMKKKKQKTSVCLHGISCEVEACGYLGVGVSV